MKVDKWLLMFGVFVIAFTIDLIILDPLPIVDEVVLGLLAFLTAYKSVGE